MAPLGGGGGVCWGRRRAFRRHLQTPDQTWPSHTWLTAGSLRSLRHRASNIGGHRALHFSGQMVLPTALAVKFQCTEPGSYVSVGHAHSGGLESWCVNFALQCATPETLLRGGGGWRGDDSRPGQFISWQWRRRAVADPSPWLHLDILLGAIKLVNEQSQPLGLQVSWIKNMIQAFNDI